MSMRSTVWVQAVLVALLAGPVLGQGAGDGAQRDYREELKQLRQELEQEFSQLERDFKRMPRERFDPQAVVEQVGREPQALYAWVHEQTDLVPYRGALRGAQGVLMDRAGNSLDRSLLLAEMLHSVGYQVRLAHATLSDDAAHKLAGEIAAGRRHSRPTAAGEASRRLVEEARQRVSKQTEVLLQALGQSSGQQATQAQLAAALADHWWVQVQQNGQWVEMDLAAAQAGQALAQAGNTYDFVNGNGKLPVQAENAHEVQLRVVIEAWKDGKLQEHKVLEQKLRPAETLERTISFTHVVGGALKHDKLKPDDNSRKSLKQTMAEQEQWLPVLRVGQEPVVKASFNVYGDVENNPKVDPSGNLGGAGTSKLGDMGSMLGAGGDQAEAAKGVLTAEWIEYEISLPGQQPQVVRRTIFDLIGPAARAAGVTTEPQLTNQDKTRRALALLGQTYILLQPCELPAEFVEYQLARAALKDREVWMSLANDEAKSAADVLKKLDRVSPRTDAARLFASIRGTISPAAGKTYVDQPNVIHWRVLIEEGPHGRLGTRQGMDLAITSTAVAGENAFATRAAQGVADTLAEHVALGLKAVATENTVGLFEAAMAKGANPVLIKSADDAAIAKLNLPADVQARVASDVKAGNLVVLVAGDGGRCGWWRVDPRTGQTVGVMDNGYHAGTTEYGKLQEEVDKMTMGVPWQVSPAEFASAGPGQAMEYLGTNTLTMQQWNAIVNLQTRIMACLNRPFTLYFF